MPRFPEVDIAVSEQIAQSLVALNAFDQLHAQAEQASALYSVGHAIIKAAVASHAMDERIESALLSGVGAYEVFGSVVQGQDVLQSYERADLSLLNTGSSGLMDVLSSLDDAYYGLNDVPELRTALRVLVSKNAPVDSSPELLERAVQGAAMLRSMQLELDMLLAFRQDLDQLF